jgi:hypothetical protein
MLVVAAASAVASMTSAKAEHSRAVRPVPAGHNLNDWHMTGAAQVCFDLIEARCVDYWDRSRSPQEVAETNNIDSGQMSSQVYSERDQKHCNDTAARAWQSCCRSSQFLGSDFQAAIMDVD